MTEPRPPSRTFPLTAVRLAAIWLLAGASFKLFLGTPADLPQLVRDLPLDIALTYKLAIAVELLFVVLALLVPRLGWITMVAIYVLFEFVLWRLVDSGAESCGCFGSTVTLTPQEMMSIDGVLLALMLISRPWKGTAVGISKFLLAPIAAAALALPFLFDREVVAPPVVEDGKQPATSPWAVLDIENWVGQSIFDTPLATLLEQDISTLPIDGMWVLWRWTCDHCAIHLEELKANPPDVPFITLVRLKETIDSEANRAVYFMPTGPEVVEASLPDTVRYDHQTPGEMMLEGGVIISAAEGVESGVESGE